MENCLLIVKALPHVMISGKEVLPILEGGKGIAISNGKTAGSFALHHAVGTFSGANAESYSKEGTPIPTVYHGKNRRDRQQELIHYGIEGGVTQAKIAHDLSQGNGRIHMNVLWEMGGVEPILEGILERSQRYIHGITCGAGMPYRLAELAAKFQVYYLPIVSSARAFRALWKRAYAKVPEWLSAVVYEDPWRAGGHNGLSNQEDPLVPQDPYPRVVALRETMREFGLQDVPIVMAGGVWYLRDWQNWIANDALGPIAFQLGTRPLLTQESPISGAWKQRLLALKEGDVFLNKFSPTGFYSSAVNNAFLKELQGRSQRQVGYTSEPKEASDTAFLTGSRSAPSYLTKVDYERVTEWLGEGYTQALKTPEETLIFVTPEKAGEILRDQRECMGCLSACMFSNWHQTLETTGQRPDPRSFCIQKTLQNISREGDVEHNLMFAGKNAYQFAKDPFYGGGFIPTVGQLIGRLQTGD